MAYSKQSRYNNVWNKCMEAKERCERRESIEIRISISYEKSLDEKAVVDKMMNGINGLIQRGYENAFDSDDTMSYDFSIRRPKNKEK